jgi:DNA-binding beta-propeller fold protein YncE
LGGNTFVRNMVARILATCLFLILPSVLVTSAEADTQIGGIGSGAGQISAPGVVAVDEAEELLYVADADNNRIDIFDAGTGAFLRAFGWGVKAGDTAVTGLDTCTVVTGCQKGFAGAAAGQLRSPRSIAIDPVSHFVHVGEEANHRVQTFKADGTFVASFGTEGEALGQFNQIKGIAVGSTGAVYVADAQSLGQCGPAGEKYARRVQKFTSTGTPLEQVLLTDAPCGELEGFAVDSGGNLYLSNSGLTGAVRKYDPAGSLLKTIDPSPGAAAIAVDAADNLFVVDGTSTSTNSEVLASAILEYDSSGTQLRSVYGDFSQVAVVRGVAPFHSAGGDVFVSEGDRSLGLGRVLHVPFPPPGPVVYPGSAKASTVRSVRATAEAKVNPEGKATTVHFEYIRDDQFIAAGNSFGAGTLSTAESAPVGADFVLHVAAGVISGLAPETKYHFRVVATNPEAPSGVIGEEGTFTTLAPLEIGATWSTDVGIDAARLHAEVNPLGSTATGYFQYVDDTRFKASGFDDATAVPDVSHGAAPIDLGAGEVPRSTAVPLVELAPQTTYHYRLVAEDHCKVAEPSVTCTFLGPERMFTTGTFPGGPESCATNAPFRIGPSAALPDCRAYELVSPLEKDGGDVLPVVQVTGYSTGLEKSATTGNGFTFSAYHGFADPQGGAIAFQYLARRDPGTGWSTESVSPPRGARSVFETNLSIESEFKAFSDDLKTAWLLHDTTPLTSCAPPGFTDIYRRDNATGVYEALNCVTPVKNVPFGGEGFVPELQGVSADGDHAVFRVADKLTPDASAGTNYQVY